MTDKINNLADAKEAFEILTLYEKKSTRFAMSVLSSRGYSAKDFDFWKSQRRKNRAAFERFKSDLSDMYSPDGEIYGHR